MLSTLCFKSLDTNTHSCPSVCQLVDYSIEINLRSFGLSRLLWFYTACNQQEKSHIRLGVQERLEDPECLEGLENLEFPEGLKGLVGFKGSGG